MSRKIRTEVESVRKAATYESNCNAYTLIRKPNTAPVSVNGYPLEEGESKTYGGNIGHDRNKSTKYKPIWRRYNC